MSYQPLRVAGFLLAVLGLSACSDDHPHMSQTPPTGMAAMGQQTERPVFEIPPRDFVTNPQLGRQLFSQNCAQCHGSEALGTDQGPPLIHRIYEPSHHADIAFFRAIALGVHQHHWNFGDMPPVEGVDGEQAAHIIAWIRQEQRKVGIE